MRPHPEELERRLGLLSEAAEQGEDIDARGWGWLILLGVIGPIVLIVLGWNA
jgi:hypothetical protein